MTDHAAAALEQLRVATDPTNGVTTRQVAVAAAQVHATLALAAAVASRATTTGVRDATCSDPDARHIGHRLAYDTRDPSAVWCVDCPYPVVQAAPAQVDDPTHAPGAVHALDPGTCRCRVHGKPWPCTSDPAKEDRS